MRILLAWELGGHYGHLLKLLPVIKLLRARGHEVLVAAKDIAIAEKALAPTRVPFVQAPVPRHRPALGRDISSYADILAVHGFADSGTLSSLSRAWQHLFDLWKPDAVVIHHAPSSLLAAKLSGLPVAELGTGFELPPLLSPYPCFRPWLKLPASALEQMEARLLDNINGLCKQRHAAPLERLSDLCAPTRMLATFSELDHYQAERAQSGSTAPYFGPLMTVDEGPEVAWPARHEKNVFVYLHLNEGIEAVLAGLGRIKANVVCVIPGLPDRVRARFLAPHLAIHDRVLKLDRLLPACDLAVTHAGHGLAATCFLAGVPMLALPSQIEQLMMVKCLGRNGTGLAVLPERVQQDFSDALAHMLTQPRFGQRARELASRYAGHDLTKMAAHVADVIEGLA